jgi:demethylmenaquinone methyltransferase / 2-methoxy-6-polyprenyl-1,4-benzoquinol methylase
MNLISCLRFNEVVKVSEEVPGPSRLEVWKMFDQISPTYDSVNRVMTFGLDQIWRKKLCSFLPKSSEMCVLDCATGTGDQIIALMQKRPDIAKVVGIDLAEAMLAIGKKKIAQKPFNDKVELRTASALEIPYPDDCFDCVTISFGIRNVTDIMAALKEFRRVLKPKGRLLILEGTVPSAKWLRRVHLFYLRHLLPSIGGVISRNYTAYRYLNETIESFPQGEKLNSKLRAAGFVHVQFNPILGGITTVYQGDKDAPLCH